MKDALTRNIKRCLLLALIAAGYVAEIQGFANILIFVLAVVFAPTSTLLAFSEGLQRKIAAEPAPPDASELDLFIGRVIRTATALALAWFGLWWLLVLYLWSIFWAAYGGARIRLIREEAKKGVVVHP